MRREVRRWMVTFLILLMPGAAAASPAAKPGPDPIPEALCGRAGRGDPMKLAVALDGFDSISVPPAWSEVEIQKFQRWLEAPVCTGASEQEIKQYQSRRKALVQLGRRLERAQVTEQIGSALAPWRVWRPSPEEWPGPLECQGCEALRSSAVRVAEVAARWPSRSSTRLGARLSEAAMREALVADLCKARPSPRAREEIERRFRYYSWTAGGAKLLEVAAFFEKPEVTAGCRGQ